LTAPPDTLTPNARRPTPEAERLTPNAFKERRWAGIAAIGTMLLTLVPYLIGASLAEDRAFLWLGYNLDDGCVYLSWMRQAAEGSYRALNLFTTEPQHGMALNPLFLVLGRIAGWTGLPLLAVFHGARLLFGVGLLLLVWEFLRLTVADSRARWLAFLFVCFSSGLGWLPNWWDDNPINTPIDKWQPEAITFLSLYLNPLFVFSMALQVGLLTLLFQGERTGQMRYAVYAGLCGFLLGLVHTYDILTMAAIWLAYLLIITVSSLRAATPLSPAAWERGAGGVRIAWLQALVAGAIAAPAVLYIAYQLRTESVFRARANVPTLSPPFVWVLLGYGLTLALALLGILALSRSYRSKTQEETVPSTLWTTSRAAGSLLIVWAVVNIAVSYLPNVPFQRKMLQGAHFPIAILAGIGAAWLLRHPKLNLQRLSFPFAATVLTLLLSLTNIRFVLRDLANDSVNLAQTKTHRAYLQPGEIQALEWIAANTPKDAAIQPLPWVPTDQHGMDATLACLTPGLIGRPVYWGHWGETPDYGGKVGELLRFGSSRVTDAERIALLRKMKARYLLFSQKSPTDLAADSRVPLFRGMMALPPYLKHVYPDASKGETNADADVYEVEASLLSTPPAESKATAP